MPAWGTSKKEPPGVRDRPEMPDGYGLKRGNKGLVAWSKVTKRLQGARNYWVATSGLDGRVHATPVWGLWYEDAFYFSTEPKSRKGKNLSYNPSIVVHLESGDDVVIIEGSAERIKLKGGSLEEFAKLYANKYDIKVDFGNPDFAVYVVRARTVYAWMEKDFPKSATRWKFGR
jgi:nitroimidazol reductase NimA-like FMN-containing flavoprotein (pyridoxamine 5'-phosphate oxidase superfamily)